jgi:hypothetical protein
VGVVIAANPEASRLMCVTACLDASMTVVHLRDVNLRRALQLRLLSRCLLWDMLPRAFLLGHTSSQFLHLS